MSDLTPDDLILLQHVAAGWTTRRISEDFRISPRRVRIQLRSLRERLEAQTNVHAVVIAIRRGII